MLNYLNNLLYCYYVSLALCEALEELYGFSIDDVLKVEAYMSKKTSKVDFSSPFGFELKVLM